MKKVKLLTVLIASIFFSYSYGQNIEMVTPNQSPADLVQNVLLGAGVNASNFTYNGSPANANTVQTSVTEFSYTGNNFPLHSGLFLRTNTAGNVSGDPDLNAIAVGTESPTNGTIIEFDFVPDGNILSFNYIFASAEYNSFTCSGYNDVFGFFISGPGISGPYSNGAINVATIPNSADIPVGINTVNSGPYDSPNGPCATANPNWQSDSQYFTTNYNSVFNSSSLDGSPLFNGATVVLPAEAMLQCGETYHIKMAIANVSDQGYHSGVFLEAGSFSAAGVNVDIQVNAEISAANVADTVLIEGCTEGTIYFTRPSNDVEDTLVIHFETDGTATQGVDYPELSPGDSIIFLPGMDTVAITISPIQDNIEEGLESVIISTFSVNACGDTVYAEGIIWIGDEPYSTVTTFDQTIYCANDSVPVWATTHGGFEPYTYEWTPNNGMDADTAFVPALENGTHEYIVASIDVCGFTYYDTAYITVNQTLFIDTMYMGMAHCGKSDGWVSGSVVGITGTPKYTWSGPGDDENAPSTSASVFQDIPSGWYYFTVEDDVCITNDSIFVDQTPPPTADFDADPSSGGSPLDVTFTNNSDSGSGYTYDWDFGNGEYTTVNDLSDQHSVYIEEGVYTVTLTVDDGFCQGSDQKEITVFLPLIYDEPNVFTPNNDGDNDLWTMNLENVESVEVVILNRWGNVVYESTDVNFAWNGKVKNTGAECTEGTYFYKVKLIGQGANSEEVEVHGFIELLRGKK